MHINHLPHSFKVTCDLKIHFLAGGVVMFTRSLIRLKRQGVRVNVLCPEVLRNCITECKYLSFAL